MENKYKKNQSIIEKSKEQEKIKEKELYEFIQDLSSEVTYYFIFRYIIIQVYAKIIVMVRECYIPFEKLTVFRGLRIPTNYYNLRYLNYFLILLLGHVFYFCIIWYYDACLYYYYMEYELEEIFKKYYLK